ncbi:MAG: hypothetical protein WBC18_15045 [Ottowia sp.]|uniref:hypothetical protein n=1 Tax=Ottowia sp. TaxID=1898956 RepID=UPI003C78B9CD
MSRAVPPSRFPLTVQPRGLRSYVWRQRNTFALLSMLALSLGLVAAAHNSIMMGWHQLLSWAWPHLGLGAAEQVGWSAAELGSFSLPLVMVRLSTPAPGQTGAVMVAVLAAGLWMASYLLPKDGLPLRYLLRLTGLLCMISVLGWLWLPAGSGISPQGAVNQLLLFGVGMLWVIPPLHALVLYIFPISLGRQFMATVKALALVGFSVPLQAGAIAWLIAHTSNLMVLPIYLLATFLPQVVIQLALYGYVVSLAPAPST